jgi:hypothetical protein
MYCEAPRGNPAVPAGTANVCMNSGRSTAATFTHHQPHGECPSPDLIVSNIGRISKDGFHAYNTGVPCAPGPPLPCHQAGPWLESDPRPTNASSTVAQPLPILQLPHMQLQRVYCSDSVHAPSNAVGPLPLQEAVAKPSESAQITDQDKDRETARGDDLSSSSFELASQASEEWVPAAQRRRVHLRPSKQGASATGGGHKEPKLSVKMRQDRR